MRSVLHAVHEAIGPAPRDIDIELPFAPDWCEPTDRLHTVYRDCQRLLKEGSLTFGRIVMANSVLWEPGDQRAAPAEVIYSFDPAYRASPGRLEFMAHRLYSFHGHDESVRLPRSPWLRLIRDREFSGFERNAHLMLPPELTGGAVVYTSSIFIFRDFLPTGVVVGHEVPLLVLRESGGTAMLLPSSFWPDVLLHMWERSALG